MQTVIMFLIDADMQQHPKYVNQMLNLLENDADLDIVACYQENVKKVASYQA